MTVEDRDNRIKEIKDKENSIVEDLRRLRPEVEIVIGKYKSEIVYYTVSVVKSKVKIEKNTRSIYIKDIPEKLIKERFLTKEQAQAAIETVLPRAKEKFEKCLEAHRTLCKELGFSTGFSYDGDTYGIYDEYDYICFKLEGFDFQFEINN
jgi:hypothetical protein